MATSVLHAVIEALSAAASLLGLLQIASLPVRHSRSSNLSVLLHRFGIIAVIVFAAFSCVIGSAKIQDINHALLVIDGGAMLVHAVSQSLFVQVGWADRFIISFYFGFRSYQTPTGQLAVFGRVFVSERKKSKRKTHILKSFPRSQELDTRQADRKNCRKGLQVVTFLVFANLVLWLMESFTNQNYLNNELAREMYGSLTWSIVARVSTPLVIFFRFHSCVFLVEAWRRSRAHCG